MFDTGVATNPITIMQRLGGWEGHGKAALIATRVIGLGHGGWLPPPRKSSGRRGTIRQLPQQLGRSGGGQGATTTPTRKKREFGGRTRHIYASLTAAGRIRLCVGARREGTSLTREKRGPGGETRIATSRPRVTRSPPGTLILAAGGFLASPLRTSGGRWSGRSTASFSRVPYILTGAHRMLSTRSKFTFRIALYI